MDTKVNTLIVWSGLAVLLLFATPLAQAPTPGAPTPRAPQSGAPGQPAGRANTASSPRTAVIRGRVLAADTGLPLRQAQVRLMGPAGAFPPGERGPAVATDDQGRYEMTGLPAGRLMLTASKNGYVALSYGQRRPPEAARPVEIADAQTLDGIDFILPQASVIVVHVTDDLGGPAAGMRVFAQQYRFNATSRELALSSTIDGETKQAATNDLGEARIHGLPPGGYYITAAPSAGRTNPLIAVSDSGRRYAEPTYYPGTPSATEAQPVSVGIGQEVTIGFRLAAVRASRVAGIFRAADGSVPPNVVVQASQERNFSGRAIPSRPDGTFEWVNVMPGRYSITVRPRSAIGVPTTTGEYASMPIVVSGEDVTGLVLTTTKGTTIRGQFAFDAGAAPGNLKPDTVQLSLREALSGGRPTTNDDWTFEIFDVAGAGVLRLLSTASGWFLKSVMFNDRDVTDTRTDFSQATDGRNLQVVLTQKRTELTGLVFDSRNAPVNEYGVVVFAEDRDRWTAQSRFIAAGRPDQQGQFKVLGLPPGRYLAAAVEDLEAGEERDPVLLTRLQAGALRLTLAEAEAKTVSIRLVTR